MFEMTFYGWPYIADGLDLRMLFSVAKTEIYCYYLDNSSLSRLISSKLAGG
jgi:hypothetical protein